MNRLKLNERGDSMLLEIPDAGTSLMQSVERKSEMEIVRRLNAEMKVRDSIFTAINMGELSTYVDWYIVDTDLREELENMGYKLKEEESSHGARLQISWGDGNGE